MTIRIWKTLLAAAVAAATLVGGVPAAAHHSAAAAYDETKKVEAQGTVTRVLPREHRRQGPEGRVAD